MLLYSTYFIKQNNEIDFDKCYTYTTYFKEKYKNKYKTFAKEKLYNKNI